ncbi:MAG: COX15/CtaA family protein, partial [Alphaproteobacteria bacterium]|nr:COX15/CtaA family protein [Alphaproteobacteria bacterium]
MAITHPMDARVAARPGDRAVGLWLLACCAMIAAMVVIGGITRLTESGLSIVRWEPIGGALPPLDHADWQRLFELYQASPQYQQVNQGMGLDDFRAIFWWEYVHRLWGRLIGVVFLVPFVWFLATGRIARSLRAPLAGLFVLGGLQGALGWWMVASGLRDVPWVSPYRLTAHLGLAVAIYAGALWLALSLLRPPAPPVPQNLRRGAWIITALVFTTLLAGGFVAGTDAGLIYNTFPWMGDGLVPPDYRNPALSLLANTFENHAAIQFHHRVLAITTVTAILVFWRVARGRTTFCAWLDTLAAFALFQMGLGIATLLLHVPTA